MSLLAYPAQAVIPIVSYIHCKAFPFQVVTDHFTELFVVFYHQDTHKESPFLQMPE